MGDRHENRFRGASSVGARAVAIARIAEDAVLGNKAGLRRTIRGAHLMHRSRAASRRMLTLDSPSRTAGQGAERLRRDGVVRLDAHVPRSLIEKVAAAFARLVADDRVTADLGPASDPGMHRYVADAHLRIPELGELLTPGVAGIIEAYYRSHFRVRSVRAYRNRGLSGRAEMLASSAWHLDPELTCDLRYFVYLDDTTVGNGAIETMSRLSTRRALFTGYVDRSRAYGPARRLLEERPVIHEGDPGTAILVDAQRVLHRAGTCAPGQVRDIVQFWTTPTATALEPDWYRKLPPDPTFHGGLPGDG